MLKLRIMCVFTIFILFASNVMAYSAHKKSIRSEKSRYKLEPAVATSYNLRKIMDAMQSQGIERAQVAGWNDHRSIYVVYSNGAVTPPVPLDYPKVAVYFKKYSDCRIEIVFLSICKEARDEKESSCDDVVINPNLCPPRPIIPICPPAPIVPICPPFPEPICRVEDSYDRKCIRKCRQFPRTNKKCIRGPLNSKGRISKHYKSCHYTNECVLGKNVPVLTIDSCKKTNSKCIVYLTNGMRVRIEILNCPALLFTIKKFAESKLGCPICLYVDRRSRVFVLKHSVLYQVCGSVLNLSLRRLSDKEKHRVESRGLYNVTFS